MSRAEFSKYIKRAALDRANGKCESCGFTLIGKMIHFDHVIPDAMGGAADLSNCAALCVCCHNEKTRKRDMPTIAKAKRVSDKHHGIHGTRQKIQSAGFRKSSAQRTASRPLRRKSEHV